MCDEAGRRATSFVVPATFRSALWVGDDAARAGIGEDPKAVAPRRGRLVAAHPRIYSEPSLVSAPGEY
jgi:hypothetical protein